MNIRINKLMLQNFKGIKGLEIYADGANLKIFGNNATGKTTVFDAFTWLLFGKDSLGRSDFGIKTQDKNGKAIHNLEHAVECELTIDEIILTLKKVYSEKWTKKRGSAEAEFSGHETKYFINEVPSTKKEYEQKIAMYIDENLFKTITNPLYFNEHLKWQDRRQILLSLCNDNVTDEDMLARSPEFSPLLDELKGRTVQEYSKIIKGKQAAINDELKAIPQRISEASLAIPEVVEIDETEKTNIEQKIADLNDEIVAIRNGSGVADAEIELRALREKRTQVENQKCDVSDENKELSELNKKLLELNFEISDCERNIRSINYCIDESKRKADSLRKEWHEVNEKQYTDSGICPTCGQNLPDEQIEKAKAKFNTIRAEKLEDITQKGKKETAEIENYTKRLNEWSKRLTELTETKKDCEADITGIEIKISDITNNFADKIKCELAKIDLSIAEAENKARNSADDIQSKIYPIQEQIASEKAKLAEIDKAIAGRDLAEKQKQRIAELSADEKRLAGEYAELDKIAFLVDTFTKYKVDLLSEEINSHFKYAKFKLFDEQINGGIAECCEVTFNGVPYSDLNNASRINIGLDIINTLGAVNGKTAPIIIDNAESITEITPTKAQTICLVVSADDDFLRVEKY